MAKDKPHSIGRHRIVKEVIKNRTRQKNSLIQVKRKESALKRSNQPINTAEICTRSTAKGNKYCNKNRTRRYSQLSSHSTAKFFAITKRKEWPRGASS